MRRLASGISDVSAVSEAETSSPGDSPGGEEPQSPRRREVKHMRSAAGAVLAGIKTKQSFKTLVRRGDVDDAIDYTQLERLRVLGRGSFGEPRTGEVALKILLPESAADEQAVADLRSELAILSKLEHSCLVSLIGSGMRTDRRSGAQSLFVVLEAVTGGDLLHTVLYALVNPKAYKDVDVTRWAHDISRGLHYLHTRKPKVIHRDLKLENVMLDAKSWKAKLTDFGLVKTLTCKTPRSPEGSTEKGASCETGASSSLTVERSLDPSGSMSTEGGNSTEDKETYTMTGGTGSFKYMAPETLKGQAANEKIDTYSFAICLWELLARSPLLFMRTKMISNGRQHGKVEYTPKLWAIDAAAGHRPEQPEEWPAALRQLMAECWAQDPAERPSQRAVMERLAVMQRPDEWTIPGSSPPPQQSGCSCCLQ